MFSEIWNYETNNGLNCVKENIHAALIINKHLEYKPTSWKQFIAG